MTKPVVLVILDGWGIAPSGPGNAVKLAQTPNLNRFAKTFPSTKLLASGQAVGLPKAEAGNTETGHLNLGAGQIVYQDLPRINQSIADGSFFQNQALLQAATHVKNFNSHLHLMGLIGTGGVHSSTLHLLTLLNFAKSQKLTKVYLHLFTDGRDSPPTSALNFIARVQKEIQKLALGQIATIIGRYYAMDRDFRWDRTQRAYQALTENKGILAESAQAAVSLAYAKKLSDEFIEPTLILDQNNQPLPRIANNDAVVFFNFRIDRPRQLTKAFVIADFQNLGGSKSFDPYDIKYHKKHYPLSQTPSQPFTRSVSLKNLFFVTFTEYEKGLPVTVAFPPQAVKRPLGKVISENNLKQLRVAETEKERFVTYYFNGLREDPFPGEDRIIVPSAKIPTYDQKPQMSAQEIVSSLLERTASGDYGLVVVNFANPDMVSHTGNIAATTKACEVVDASLGKITLNLLGIGGTVLITADHGNAEQMISAGSGEVNTEHSTNPVPLIIISDQLTGKPITLEQGILADVAPTILKLLNIPKPPEMTGRELI